MRHLRHPAKVFFDILSKKALYLVIPRLGKNISESMQNMTESKKSHKICPDIMKSLALE